MGESPRPVDVLPRRFFSFRFSAAGVLSASSMATDEEQEAREARDELFFRISCVALILPANRFGKQQPNSDSLKSKSKYYGVKILECSTVSC